MKTFAASVAVWGVLALACVQLTGSVRPAYWSGVGLVIFWIVFGTVWLSRQSERGSAPATDRRDWPAGIP